MKLLVTRHDKIGDFVVTLPLIKAIKSQYPEIKLVVLVSAVNYALAQEIDYIDDVMLYDKNDFWGMLRRLKNERFDASISAYIDMRLGMLLWLSGIVLRVAPATKIAQIFFNHRITQRRSQAHKSEWAYNLDLGRALFPAFRLEVEHPIIQVPSVVQSSKTVVFHAGSGGSSEGNLRIDDYLRLGRKASTLEAVHVVFTFGPDDVAVKNYIQNHLDFTAEILDSSMTLIEFCRYLAGVTLFVSTSTGPMHLAGAVNTATLSFFGNSRFASFKRWATVSESDKQHNYMIDDGYKEEFYTAIENKMVEILTDEFYEKNQKKGDAQ